MTEQRLRTRWLKEDEAAIDAAVGGLLQLPEGRKALWWLLRIGRVGTQPMANNALQTAFACGELNVGQQILDRITTVSPEGYVNMMKEMADERGRRDTELGTVRNDRGDNGSGDDDGDELNDRNGEPR